MNHEQNLTRKGGGFSTPTFIDGPSIFLSNLTTKTHSNSDIQMKNSNLNSNNSSISNDIQRVKYELTNMVKTVSSKQDLELRQLINQLSQIQQEFKPKIMNLENQQGFNQKRIDDARQQIQKASIEDLQSLQAQYDHLISKFDRFNKVDFEAQMKPTSDDLFKINARLAGLMETMYSSTRKLNENIQDTSEKIDSYIITQSSRITPLESIKNIIPRINSLEIHMIQLKELLTDSSYNYKNYAIKPGKSVQKIDELNSRLIDSIKELSRYCEVNTFELQTSLSNISNTYNQHDLQRKEIQKSLDSQLKLLIGIQEKIKNTELNYNKKLNLITQNSNSVMHELKSKILSIQAQIAKSKNEFENEATNDINSLQDQLNMMIQKINNSIKVSTDGNRSAQHEALIQESYIRKQIEGSENALVRIKAIEDQIQWCIDAISEVNKKRLTMNLKGSNTFILLKRISNLECRLQIAEKRLEKIDGIKPPNQPKVVCRVENILPLPQNTSKSGDIIKNFEKRAEKRKLPKIPEKLFPEENTSD